MTPPLPILDMSETELNGVLFAEFPNDWTLERSRRALERLIRRCGELEITPATILTAFSAERRRNFDRLPPEVRARKLAAALSSAKKGAPELLPKIKPEEWSF